MPTPSPIRTPTGGSRSTSDARRGGWPLRGAPPSPRPPHTLFLRLDVLQSLGGFPTAGATEDSTLGYALGQRGILIQALPMVELTDLPETSEKVIRQNARWDLGVLDDIPFLRRAWREGPTPFNLAQLVRHVGNKVIEWPIAALVYPVTGWLGRAPGPPATRGDTRALHVG